MRVGRVGRDSHRGRKRRHNEDSYLVEPPLFAVADGMGGAQAGELASRLAAGALAGAGAEPGGAARVTELVQEANRRVYDRASSDESVSGMGTTMTVALFDGERVHIGHVGDSRAYLVRDARIEQLTEDHSLVGELVRSGKLSPEEAEGHPQRSVITRALGTDPDVDVDTFPVEARPGDVFVICSDGLTTMVADEAIRRVVESRQHDLEGAAKELVKMANHRGGEDNITVVLFEIADEAGETREFEALGAAPPPPPDEEDTLDEMDAVPAVTTMVVPVERLRAGDDGLADAPTLETRPGREAREGAAARRLLDEPRVDRRGVLLLWIGAAVAVLIVVAALIAWAVS